MYTCSKCGKEVKVVDGITIPSCECGAAVVVNISATATGAGGVK